MKRVNSMKPLLKPQNTDIRLEYEYFVYPSTKPVQTTNQFKEKYNSLCEHIWVCVLKKCL